MGEASTVVVLPEICFVFPTLLQIYSDSTAISPEIKAKERTLIVKETYFRTNTTLFFQPAGKKLFGFILCDAG